MKETLLHQNMGRNAPLFQGSFLFFDQMLTRSIGYLPYFYFAPRLVFPNAGSIGAALVVSIWFAVACGIASHGLTHWQHHLASRASPVRTWASATAILFAVPTIGTLFLAILTPELREAHNDEETFLVFLKIWALLLPPFAIFLGVQACTRKCPYIERRLMDDGDPHRNATIPPTPNVSNTNSSALRDQSPRTS